MIQRLKRRKNLMIFALLAASSIIFGILGIFGIFDPADSIAAESAEVILYEHGGYGGRAFGPLGTSFGNLRDYNFGNQVSSIRIRGGMYAHLYGEPNYGGELYF